VERKLIAQVLLQKQIANDASSFPNVIQIEACKCHPMSFLARKKPFRSLSQTRLTNCMLRGKIINVALLSKARAPLRTLTSS
jgi:hypothetical protein